MSRPGRTHATRGVCAQHDRAAMAIPLPQGETRPRPGAAYRTQHGDPSQWSADEIEAYLDLSVGEAKGGTRP